MNRNLFAIFYHNALNEPITQSISEQHKFAELCECFPTDWAHLMDAQTGEIVESYSKEPTSWSNN